MKCNKCETELDEKNIDGRFICCTKCKKFVPVIKTEIKNIIKLNKKEEKMVEKKQTIKSQVVKLLEEGKTDDEIVTQLGCRNLYVQLIRKQLKK